LAWTALLPSPLSSTPFSLLARQQAGPLAWRSTAAPLEGILDCVEDPFTNPHKKGPHKAPPLRPALQPRTGRGTLVAPCGAPPFPPSPRLPPRPRRCRWTRAAGAHGKLQVGWRGVGTATQMSHRLRGWCAAVSILLTRLPPHRTAPGGVAGVGLRWEHVGWHELPDGGAEMGARWVARAAGWRG
jgi:hypothetical protein